VTFVDVVVVSFSLRCDDELRVWGLYQVRGCFTLAVGVLHALVLLACVFVVTVFVRFFIN
jgi:hypothetical protein